MSKKWVLASLLAALEFIGPGSSQAQLRVVDYNTAGLSAGPRAGMATVLEALGDESVNGIAKPPDVFALQEQRTNGATTQAIVSLLNGIYGAGAYAMAPQESGGGSTGMPGLIYNIRTVQLIGQTTASVPSTTGAARSTVRYELRPVGYDSAADFYVYSSHYKSSDSSEDRARRNIEAQQVRANADALGQGAHIIYAGDFNIYNSSEPMFQTLTAAGNGQAFDPVNRIGNWHENSAFRDVHTQTPGTIIGGGIDDRFDWQMVTGEFLDNEGLSYIGGSYRAFGNTGTHALKGTLSSGSAAALAERLPGYTEAQAGAVLSALETASDHLPVVADYQLPAKMTVAVLASPGAVIVDAEAAATFSVSNSAPVVAANGADELDYTFSGSGNLIGTGSGIDHALGSVNTHQVTLDTDTPGQHSGGLHVVSSSQAAADAVFSQTLTYTVLDHAQASLSASEIVKSDVLEFGLLDLASGPITLEASLSNLLSPSGYTAGLDLDGILASGDTAWFTLSLQTFENLAAGTTASFASTFLGNAPAGTYTATYQFLLSDQDLPGSASLDLLSLTLTATIIPEPQPLTLTALAIILLRFRHLRARRK
jgi:exonuclease III